MERKIVNKLYLVSILYGVCGFNGATYVEAKTKTEHCNDLFLYPENVVSRPFLLSEINAFLAARS